jgi:WD40 repeat protein
VKRLTLSRVQFTKVAYINDQMLLSSDFFRGDHRYRIWNLANDSPPREVLWPQALAVFQLFKPWAAQFLRRQGLWPEADELPPAFAQDPNWLPPVLEPIENCEPFFHPDGETVAFCETVAGPRYQSRFHLRDSAGRLHALLLTRGAFGFSGAFSPNGCRLALTNGQAVAWVWDVAGRRELGQLTQGDSIKALAFLDNDRLAVAAGRTVRVWDVPGQREAMKFPAFRKYVDALGVAPDLRLFAAGSRDGSVRVWDAATGHELARHDCGIGAVSALAFAPDGQTAAAAGEKGIVVWDLD